MPNAKKQTAYMKLIKNQARWAGAAKALAERGIDETLGSVAKRAGTTTRTLHRYLKDFDFCEMVKKLTDAALIRYMPQIDKAMVKKALEGSVPAANFIAQRGGRTLQVIKDKSLEDFVRKLDVSDREELEFYDKHGHWPDERGTVEEILVDEASGTVQ